MKTDRHYPKSVSRWTGISLAMLAISVSLGSGAGWAQSTVQPTAVVPSASFLGPAAPAAPTDAPETSLASQPDLGNSQQARSLLLRVIKYLTNGPAFDAKFRETVHASGREVVGVGTYEQSGGATGRYHMQLTMLDGDGRHKLSQINDGVLAWTRSEIADQVLLRRIDVARLDEWVPQPQRFEHLAPRLLVGGWAEMLMKIYQDYELRLDSAVLQEQPVAVLIADLKPETRQRILNQTGIGELPELFPVRVQIAIATQDHPEHRFGRSMPIRWEYRSAPETITLADGSERTTNGRLVTLIEMYSIRPIDPPSRDRFRFENHEAEVNFVNETDRYLTHYGVRVAATPARSQRR